MQKEAVIVAKNLGKTVETGESQLTILRGLDLEVKSGESVAIVGASGSGKSTLLGLLAGLDESSEGKVILGGESLTDLDEEGRAALRARKVGFVFQSFLLVAGLSALENVMLPLELKGDRREARLRASEMLERVGLAHRTQHYPNQLSGGEQQRVALARAFVSSPEILFADEPTGNLDHANGSRVADLLFGMNRDAGTTLVLVTHDLKLAQRCDRVLTMDSGTLSEGETSADPQEISACG